MMNTLKRKLILAAIFMVTIVSLTAIGRLAILGDSVSVGAPEDTIEEQVSHSLRDTLTPGAEPVEGKDYTLQDKKYFEDRQWLVATVEPVEKNAADPATIVMQVRNGAFVIVLGPGTAFPADQVDTLPKSVAEHLRQNGRVSNNLHESQ